MVHMGHHASHGNNLMKQPQNQMRCMPYLPTHTRTHLWQQPCWVAESDELQLWCSSSQSLHQVVDSNVGGRGGQHPAASSNLLQDHLQHSRCLPSAFENTQHTWCKQARKHSQTDMGTCKDTTCCMHPLTAFHQGEQTHSQGW